MKRSMIVLGIFVVALLAVLGSYILGNGGNLEPLLTQMRQGNYTGSRNATVQLLGILETGDLDETRRKTVISAMASALGDPKTSDAVKSVLATDVRSKPVLEHALRHGSTAARLNAAEALSELAKAGHPGMVEQAAAELSQLVTHESPAVRAQAIRALAALGDPAVPVLVRSLTLDPADARNTVLVQDAGAGLARSPDAAMPHLLEALSSDDPNRQANAAVVLRLVGPEHGKQALGRLVELLKSENDHVRAGVIETLGSYGSAARGAMDDLIDMLSEPEHFFPAVVAVRSIGPTQQDAPELTAAFKFADSENKRRELALTLVQIGWPSYAVAVDALDHPDQAVRHGACVTLSTLLTAAPEMDYSTAVEKLTALVRKGPLAEPAAEALGQLHGNAKPAVPAIIEQLRKKLADKELSRNLYTVGQLGQALAKIGDLPTVLGLLKKDNAKMQVAALGVIGQMEPNALDAAEPVLAMLKSDQAAVRFAALRALTELKGKMDQYVPAVEPLLSDPEPVVRSAATKTIESMRSKSF
ncbi:MAG: HEAT repeat domain-containing protein [Phycisphaerae bacterium]